MIPIEFAVAAVAIAALFYGCYREQAWLVVVSTAILLPCIFTYCDGRPEAIAERKATAQAAQRAATPHVIREADGCKVYAFTAGPSEHYFTRCADAVTTERHYTELVQHGKAYREEPRSEVIVTSKAP